MKLYIVRHGKSVDSGNKTRQRPESPLNELGQQQAALIAKRASHLEINQLWSSPYARTYQTAKIISATLGLPIISEPLAKEQDPPTLVQGLEFTHPEVLRINSILASHSLESNYSYSDEETFLEVKERAVKLKNKFEKISDQNVLLVTHGNFTRMFMAVVLFGSHLTPKIYLPFTLIFTTANTGLTVFEITYQSEWKLLAWNDQSHLGE